METLSQKNFKLLHGRFFFIRIEIEVYCKSFKTFFFSHSRIVGRKVRGVINSLQIKIQHYARTVEEIKYFLRSNQREKIKQLVLTANKLKQANVIIVNIVG